MERLSGAVVVSRASQPRYETPNLPSLTLDRLPAECAPIDRLSGIVSWRGVDGSVEIARPLTDGECRALEQRKIELGRALEPFDRERPRDMDRVAEAAGDMYGSFPSMRQEGADALAKIDSLMNSLVRSLFPTWVIEQACRTIQDNGYQRSDGKKSWTECQWAPSDSEVARVAMRIVRLRSEALTNAKAILTAPVAAPPAPKPTKAEIEAKLGRSISDEKPQKDGAQDGGHAARVAADLAARKAAREKMD